MRDLREVNAKCHDIGDDGGAFEVSSPIDKAPMVVLASIGLGWDHVSVSRKSRCPNWGELEFVKRIFFKDDEAVVQFHVPVRDHISIHPNCLHLWRKQGYEFPMPPIVMV